MVVLIDHNFGHPIQDTQLRGAAVCAGLKDSVQQGIGDAPLLMLNLERNGLVVEAQDPAADVDHFVPWSKYPRDLAENLVLAHAACNRSKSDILAAAKHLDHWLERNARDGPELAAVLGQVGFIADEACALFEPTQVLPRAREIYRDMVARLEAVEDVTAEREALRSLIGDVRLVPEGYEAGNIMVVLYDHNLPLMV